ncbi:hypothetical protein tb265_30580 [Gemmatimonadetes bacterium T265]|nr:hypothetical protein tb265_30580 [Gemmatimonadetes bacterium T265]
MSPERWHRVQAVFGDAAERPAAERAAYLDAACAGDAALRAEVESLLDAEANAPGLLDATRSALASLLCGDAADAPSSAAGRTVGPYRVLHEIGRGGMGTVYLAERSDVARRVALKLVRDPLAAPERVRRMLVERRVLARLDHPNIARLLDAGVTADGGTPWFAMEYVEGAPIDRACDARRLTIAERLALFEQVCKAVQYAHGALVVHRDLKPSNILVTDSAEVKLLDFGIAKLLGDDPDAPGCVTRTEARLLTPEYAAPEQLRGEPVTTTTDVYALGCVLYELLTGHRARAGRDGMSDVGRYAPPGDPPRPSAAVARTSEAAGKRGGVPQVTPEVVSAARRSTPAGLQRQLQGDLDTIVLKALAAEPARRYPSAQQLLDDLRSHRAGRPVAARPDTWRYRARKFVGRNRAAVGALAAFVSLLGGFAAVMTYQRAELARERNRAQRELTTAETASAFLADIFLSTPIVDARGNGITATDLLARGVRSTADLADNPDLQVRMLLGFGRAYNDRADYARARSILAQALALARRLHPGDDLDVGESLWALGRTLYNAGDLAGAERLLREALAMRRRLFGPRHQSTLRSLTALASLLQTRGELDESERLYREALAAAPATFGGPHRDWSVVLNGLGRVLYEEGRYTETEPLLREAVTMMRRTSGDDDQAASAHLSALGELLRARGRLAEAGTLQREAVAGARRVLGPRHPLVAPKLDALAAVLRDEGDLAGAEATFREALAIQRASLPAGHVGTAVTLAGLGGVLTARGRAAEAEPMLRAALEIDRRDLVVGSRQTAEARAALGRCVLALAPPAAVGANARASTAAPRDR